MCAERYFDWHRLRTAQRARGAVVDSRRRARLCLLAFVALLSAVFGRLVQLEITEGATARADAAGPLVRRQSLPGVRGRILARNGTVLAQEREILCVAVHYRWLEEPPNPQWLRSQAAARLSPARRRDPKQLAAEEAALRAERAEFVRRLTRLTGTSVDAWRDRARRVQTRVERIARGVNRRRQDESRRNLVGSAAAVPPSKAARSESLVERVAARLVDWLRASMDEPPPEPITVAEELDYHVMVEDVPLAVVAELEADLQRYPGVKIVQRRRRAYPCGDLAAHVLGHLGAVDEIELQADGTADVYHPEDRVGRAGLELQYERLLRGRRGLAVELTDRSGRVLASYHRREPEVGRDLVLTLDPELQRVAESLLASALGRRKMLDADREPAGGAIVVMDVHGGQILVAASAPSFDPNLFAGDHEADVQTLFSDPASPLFDRAVKMAVPPGSVFKVVAAAALVGESAVDPQESFYCRGYLERPDRRRCAIYVRHGVGHGEVTLCDALAESCNVYFFHHARRLGPDALVDWASRLGFGQPTGIDLPGEASGMVPAPATIRGIEGHAWRTADTEELAVGEGSLEVTPLQVVRMMAAIANGGLLVTPHVASGLGLPEITGEPPAARRPEFADDPILVPPPRPIPGLAPSTLALVRRGLERVVADPRGTAHASVHLDGIPIAGKTGTAETGAGRAPHAWFAGYVPADRPKLAFVVVLEHAGDAAETAGPVANRLVRGMRQLGSFRGDARSTSTTGCTAAK